MSKPLILPNGEKPTCPACGKQLAGATSATGKEIIPKTNDLSVCAYCGELLIFHDDGIALLGDDLIGLDLDTQALLLNIREAVLLRNNFSPFAALLSKAPPLPPA